jgi:hypothetical protein
MRDCVRIAIMADVPREFTDLTALYVSLLTPEPESDQ